MDGTRKHDKMKDEATNKSARMFLNQLEKRFAMGKRKAPAAGMATMSINSIWCSISSQSDFILM